MLDDSRQPIKIRRIIGNHQRVAAGIGIHGAGRADQGAQCLQHLGSGLVLQGKDTGLRFAAYLVLALACDWRSIKLCIRLGQDKNHVIDFDRSEALHAQSRQNDLVGHFRRDRIRRSYLQGSLHSRIDNDGLAANAAHGLDHRTDFGIDKIQGDLFGGRAGHKCDVTQQAGEARCIEQISDRARTTPWQFLHGHFRGGFGGGPALDRPGPDFISSCHSEPLPRRVTRSAATAASTSPG